MSRFNDRGIFLQLMPQSPSTPLGPEVSMQLAFKELGWDPENGVQTESLVDSIYMTAYSEDGGRSFNIKSVKSDVDGDGDIDSDDKAKLLALAAAYSRIVKP